MLSKDASSCPPISESAKVGCRSGDEPGCWSCCRNIGQPDCYTLSSPYKGNWLISETGCAPGCKPCARCSKDSEATYCRLVETAVSCDCDHLDIGNDPCIQPDGCACECAAYLATRSMCAP
jgi:hypothetical protein